MREAQPLAKSIVLLLALAMPMDTGAAQGTQSVTASGDTASIPAPSPREHLGFDVGADFKLAGWDTITAYFNRLALASPRLAVDTLGRTTRGRPFVVLTVTAPNNMARLEEIRRAQSRLADPRGLEADDLARLLDEQPAVVLIAHNIHSTEIASSQGVMELAYTLATDPNLASTLEQIVVLLVPSINPDGQQLVVDWYGRTVGTPYEGSSMPWLYHHYVGHDNNRDWFMLTQVETQLVTDLLYRRWWPEVVYDVHQMGNSGARFFVPPFDDPVNPNIDPLLVRSISLFGLQMSTDLEAAGKSGVVNYNRFDLWWHGGLRTVPARHNMVGILSEAASARLASPIFQSPGEADRQPDRGVHYPNPWPGGWWRLRDIIDYQLIAARSLIDLAVRQRRRLIENYVELGRRAVAAGREGTPFAYIIPAEQRDVGTAVSLLKILHRGGVEIHRAEAPFEADGVRHSAGDWVVLLAQPYRAHAKDLLERQTYPDRRLYSGGPPDTPYDVAGWTLPLQMGVEAIEVTSPFEAELAVVDSLRTPRGAVRGGSVFAINNTTNAANLAIHRVIAAGGEVAFVSSSDGTGTGPPVGGALLRGPGVRDALTELAASHGLSARSGAGTFQGYRIAELQVGLYQPWTASMDEGWTRWVFETWEMPYQTLHDTQIRAADLRSRYDVIILPDVSSEDIVEGRSPGTVPPEYAGGIGDAGVRALREFVRGGGTLVCLDSSADFAIEYLGIPVENVRPSFEEQRSGQAFYAPGSILAVDLATDHPLTFGMPERSAVYYANGPVFAADEEGAVQVVARYPDAGQLLSGYTLQPEFLAGKAALVEARQGDGRVILFGFRPQHRGQTHETFKLLFNAVYRGAARGPEALEF